MLNILRTNNVDIEELIYVLSELYPSKKDEIINKLYNSSNKSLISIDDSDNINIILDPEQSINSIYGSLCSIDFIYDSELIILMGKNIKNDIVIEIKSINSLEKIKTVLDEYEKTKIFDAYCSYFFQCYDILYLYISNITIQHINKMTFEFLKSRCNNFSVDMFLRNKKIKKLC